MLNRDLTEEFSTGNAKSLNQAGISDASQIRAIAAYYDWHYHKISINLENEVTVSFFPEIIGKELAKASSEEIADIEIMPSGKYLYWESLDLKINIASLFAEILGFQSSMATEIGRKGGSVRSESKANAARNNGKKGGRPRKVNSKEVVETISQMNRPLPNTGKVQIRGLLKIDKVSSTDTEVDAEYENNLIEEYL